MSHTVVPCSLHVGYMMTADESFPDLKSPQAVTIYIWVSQIVICRPSCWQLSKKTLGTTRLESIIIDFKVKYSL